jgi:hypothetical protein
MANNTRPVLRPDRTCVMQSCTDAFDPTRTLGSLVLLISFSRDAWVVCDLSDGREIV